VESNYIKVVHIEIDASRLNENRHNHFPTRYLWKLKIPVKIKIFMWFLQKKVWLTKGNLSTRKWSGRKNFAFVILRKQ
jgi:hypothetical protein